ncbi:hypothetical protein N5U14_00270 [Aliarcobacter butzleri]|uniref:hypothetical protein n=1 Tax=Aliarcobacter butzleri TaxID=28197 RepID=UPI0021B341FF|nr:hypothetical protein [Aliarcobacter butzleri]MCT7609272.1 hypothetical protein [Aliarcobacter butzleri]
MDNILDKINAIGTLLSGIIALIAYCTTIKYKKDVTRRNSSKANLNLALEFLKHSFETLTNNKENKLPKNDRLIWLTCARQIITAHNLSKNITEDEDKKSYETYREFWRVKFLELLREHKNKINLEYFSNKKEDLIFTQKNIVPNEILMENEKESRNPISKDSLNVILAFIYSEENQYLSLDMKLSDKQIILIRFDFPIFYEYLEEYKKIYQN